MSGSRQFRSLGRLKNRLRVLPLSLNSSCMTLKKTPRKNCPREFLGARSFISQDFARSYFSRRLIKYCLFEAIMSRAYRCPKFTVQFDGPTKPCRLIVLILRTQMNHKLRSFVFSIQSHRIEDQRSEPPPSAPTVPDEDFFGLILRLQSNRMDDQRSSAPGGRKLQFQPRR